MDSTPRLGLRHLLANEAQKACAPERRTGGTRRRDWPQHAFARDLIRACRRHADGEACKRLPPGGTQEPDSRPRLRHELQ
jgi:hypothetical protein